MKQDFRIKCSGAFCNSDIISGRCSLVDTYRRCRVTCCDHHGNLRYRTRRFLTYADTQSG